MTSVEHVSNIDFSWVHFSWVILIGALSSISLPLGTALGLALKPKEKMTGILAAFGAGALIAALAIELVAPTIQEMMDVRAGGDNSEGVHSFIALIIGCLLGGIIFVVLDHVINSYGGFLRKTSTIINYFSRKKREQDEKLIAEISTVPILQNVSREVIQTFVNKISEKRFLSGETLFKENDEGDCLYFIRSGQVEILSQDRQVALSEAGDTVGEIALLSDSPRTATAKAVGEVIGWRITKEDFDDLQHQSPEFRQSSTELALERLKGLEEHHKKSSAESQKWIHSMLEGLENKISIPSEKDLKEAKGQHSNATFAVWLGIFLDGIPESFVIGATFLTMLATKGIDSSLSELIPYTLIAGLFLSNFPEALSSSVGMKRQGLKTWKIYALWGSLVVVISIGAALGYIISDNISHTTLVGIEGLAAGAMLTMIASAMIPEAVHLGGEKSVGLSTLVGFLSAISFKLLE